MRQLWCWLCLHKERRVKVKEKEGRDGGRASFNGGGVGSEPEKDTSDGFGKIEDCGSQRQVDV